MNRRVRFHPAARKEFRQAAAFYRRVSKPLADAFLKELLNLLDLVLGQPLMGTPIEGGTRRVLLYRFPYALIYRAREDRIQIVAVMHQHRKPGYWLERVQ